MGVRFAVASKRAVHEAAALHQSGRERVVAGHVGREQHDRACRPFVVEDAGPGRRDQQHRSDEERDHGAAAPAATARGGWLAVLRGWRVGVRPPATLLPRRRAAERPGRRVRVLLRRRKGIRPGRWVGVRGGRVSTGRRAGGRLGRGLPGGRAAARVTVGLTVVGRLARVGRRACSGRPRLGGSGGARPPVARLGGGQDHPRSDVPVASTKADHLPRQRCHQDPSAAPGPDTPASACAPAPNGRRRRESHSPGIACTNGNFRIPRSRRRSWRARHGDRSYLGTRAVQVVVRVNMTCVTPLGDEVASTW